MFHPNFVIVDEKNIVAYPYPTAVNQLPGSFLVFYVYDRCDRRGQHRSKQSHEDQLPQ